MLLSYAVLRFKELVELVLEQEAMMLHIRQKLEVMAKTEAGGSARMPLGAEEPEAEEADIELNEREVQGLLSRGSLLKVANQSTASTSSKQTTTSSLLSGKPKSPPQTKTPLTTTTVMPPPATGTVATVVPAGVAPTANTDLAAPQPAPAATTPAGRGKGLMKSAPKRTVVVEEPAEEEDEPAEEEQQETQDASG